MKESISGAVLEAFCVTSRDGRGRFYVDFVENPRGRSTNKVWVEAPDGSLFTFPLVNLLAAEEHTGDEFNIVGNVWMNAQEVSKARAYYAGYNPDRERRSLRRAPEQ